jgi:hypothetical protein
MRGNDRGIYRGETTVGIADTFDHAVELIHEECVEYNPPIEVKESDDRPLSSLDSTFFDVTNSDQYGSGFISQFVVRPRYLYEG